MDTSRHDHALLAALLACALASAGSAQPTTPQGSYDYVAGQEPRVSTTMIALLVAVIAVFLFIAVSTIYLRHCTGYDAYATGPADRGGSIPADAFVSRRQRRPRGLDAEVLEMFPIMKYAEAKALRVEKVVAALECAVCLSEFEDEEKLRLLPKCSHAFHPECIGEWLASHVTCPVCRCNLDPNKDTGSDDELTFPAPVPSSTSSEIAVVRQEDGAQPAAVVIDVVAVEEEEERRKEAMELQQIGTKRRAMRSRSGRRPVMAQLVRWHSTGHSLAVLLDRDLERFTLRLPEHVRREMIASGEISSRRGRRAGEGSSRGGRLGRSGRWPSFLSYTRTLSGRLAFFTASRRTDSSDGGEVSSSLSTRIKGKRVAAVDVADGSAKGVVRLDRIGGSVSGAKVGAVAVDVEKATSRQVRT